MIINASKILRFECLHAVSSIVLRKICIGMARVSVLSDVMATFTLARSPSLTE